MDFYIGWSHSDAVYSDYFSDCSMLISAVPGNYRPLRKFRRQPVRLIVDSGALFYGAQDQPPTTRQIFHKQLEIIEDAPTTMPIQLVQVDRPMLNRRTLSEKYEAMERTLFNAYEYLNLFARERFPAHIEPMGAIQGFDLPSIQYCVHELRKMGYKRFGIGSLLALNALQQMNFIEHAASLVGAERLHVFGVTGIPQIRKMVQLGVKSLDSSRPTMVAAFYQVLYSNPFRTYVLENSNVSHKNRRINRPLPCDCPVCVERPEDILIPSPRHYMKLRSIHNYYHLKKEIEQIERDRGRNDNAVSDVLRT